MIIRPGYEIKLMEPTPIVRWGIEWEYGYRGHWAFWPVRVGYWK